MLWLGMHPKSHPDMLGYLTGMVSEDDPRSAREQFHANYQGGWSPFRGFELVARDGLKYPGDPVMPPLFRTHLRDEEITLYPHAWVMVRQADGTYEVSRMD